MSKPVSADVCLAIINVSVPASEGANPEPTSAVWLRNCASEQPTPQFFIAAALRPSRTKFDASAMARRPNGDVFETERPRYLAGPPIGVRRVHLYDALLDGRRLRPR